MSRDLLDENYYITSGGKIPVKWTAPEVQYHNYLIAVVYKHVLYSIRHFTSGSTRFKVMCGVMDLWYMRYGVWGIDRLKMYLILRFVFIIMNVLFYSDIM